MADSSTKQAASGFAIRHATTMLGADALGKAVLLMSSPALAALLTPESFGGLVMLQAMWAVVVLAQFGGADCALPLQAADRRENRGVVFAGCTRIALLALPVVWGVMTLSVMWLRPANGLTGLDHLLFLLALPPVGYASWQLYLLRFARLGVEFGKGTLVLKTVVPLVALAAVAFWPAPSERLSAYFFVLACGSAGGAAYIYLVRRKRLPLDKAAVPKGKVPLYFCTGALLLPGSLAYAAVWASDRILAGALFGPVAAGIVGVAALIGSTILLMKAWLGLVWEPIVVQWAASGAGPDLTARIQRVFEYACLAFFGAAALGAIWAPSVIRLIYPEALHPAADLVHWYFAAAALAGVAGIASATILIARASRAHLMTQIGALGVCACVVVLGAPSFGYSALPVALVASEAFILATWLYLALVHFRNLPLCLGRSAVLALTLAACVFGASLQRHQGLVAEALASAAVLAIGAVAYAVFTRKARRWSVTGMSLRKGCKACKR